MHKVTIAPPPLNFGRLDSHLSPLRSVAAPRAAGCNTMYLQTSVSLDESTAELTPEQLDNIIKSVQQQKKKLEDDIAKYIREKQNELRAFEQKLLAHASTASTTSVSSNEMEVQPQSPIHEIHKAPEQHVMESKHEAQPSTPSLEVEPNVPNTLVRERDLELCGLITPSFLPLLDASSSRASEKARIPQSKRKDVAEKPDLALAEKENSKFINTKLFSDNMTRQEMGGETSARACIPVRAGNSASVTPMRNEEGESKSKRAAIRKSSLRHVVNPKPAIRRKRVSLVVDDQIVHPSDSIGDTELASPASETTTTSASLEDLQEAIKQMMNVGKPSVNLDNNETLTGQPTSHIPDEPTPPQAVIDEFLAEDPITMSPEEREAIYSHDYEAPSSSYVGGYYGSGVDNVDQSGSYGYPSSEGASYMERYMAKRPLSVRQAAAEAEAAAIREEEEEAAKKALEDDFVKQLKVVRKDDVLDGHFLGEMEDI